MNNTRTELQFDKEKDDPEFTVRFRRDISLCIGIGFLGTLGLIATVVNMEAIDAFFSEVIKMLFL